MKTGIVLIGPAGAGKTTIAPLLGERLNLPVVSLDNLRWNYFAEIGYDRAHGEAIRREQGFPALVRHWKPYDVYSVERILADHANCVFEFGAGQVIQDDLALSERVRHALEPYAHVVLLLPSPDLEESVRILQERLLVVTAEYGPELARILTNENRLMLQHSAFYQLATLTVYSAGQTLDETAVSVAREIRQSKNPAAD